MGRVEELSVSDYPEATAYQVIKFLMAFHSELSHKINQAGTEDELRFICQLIESQGDFLELLDNAHTAQTPRALAQLLKVLMDGIEPASGVVVVPRATYNYSIIDLGYTLKEYVEQWIPQSSHHKFDEYTSAPIKLISFPRIERDNIVAHAVFGHELGHPIATAFLEKERVDPAHQAEQTEIQKEIHAIVQSLMKGVVDAVKELNLKTKIFDTVLQVRERAIEELLSDYVGFLIFGPSAVIAMHDLLWTGDWDAPPVADDWYPPSRMRLRLMMKYLSESGFLEDFSASKDARMGEYFKSVESFIEQAKQLVVQDSDQISLKDSDVRALAYRWMEQSLPAAILFAKEKVKNVVFDAKAAVEQMPELLHRLELGIPPNETGDSLNPKPVDFRASILAACVYKLRGVDASGQELTTAALEKLNLQTLLAVEYVILRDKYVSHLTASAGAGVSQ